VPSTWLETGPLTVLEAFAAGLPVAGSDLGGIQELLAGVPGCALVPLEVESWFEHFKALLSDPGKISALVPSPPGFSEMAASLRNLYGVVSGTVAER
jgi:glycosyltransferase involved in cell wall biosynthesis